MVEGQISHDQITRFLSEEEHTSKELWLQVKATVRKVERADGVLIFDDTIQEKPYTDENEVMCWHYDHSKGQYRASIFSTVCTMLMTFPFQWHSRSSKNRSSIAISKLAGENEPVW